MFMGNIFANGSLSAKFAKIFSHENFLLYGNFYNSAVKCRNGDIGLCTSLYSTKAQKQWW